MSGTTQLTQYGMFIDGEWKQSTGGDTIKVINPATEEVFATVPKAGRDEVKEAIDAAKSAQPKWEDLSPLERSSYLMKIADLIDQDRERLARILTMEQGKPIYESRLEVQGSATNFRYYAEFARRIEGDVLPSDYPRQSIMILKTAYWCSWLDYSVELSLCDGRKEACARPNNRQYCRDKTFQQYSAEYLWNLLN